MKKILVFSSFTLLLVACKKEGCMDHEAINYDPKAKKDNGSCNYVASIVFWQDQENADQKVSAGHTIYNFYINGQLKGSTSTSIYDIDGISPDCGDPALLNVDLDLGHNYTDVISLSITNQNGVQLYLNDSKVIYGDCNKIQLLP